MDAGTTMPLYPYTMLTDDNTHNWNDFNFR